MAEFDFIVGGIEDGMMALLKFRYQRRDDNLNGYLKDVGSYAGQLDEKSLKNAVEAFSGNLPLALVAYGQGVDKEMPATSAAGGAPRIWEHRCIFTVFAFDNNARSEVAQRRGAIGDVGVYKMIADFRYALVGVRFAWRPAVDEEPATVVGLVPNRKLPAGYVALNLEPFRLDGIDYVARLDGLTVYAAHFETCFDWTEPDRRVADVAVDELIFDVTPDGDGSSGPGGLPGVIVG